MEKLFYALISDKQIKRSMAILEVLYYNNHDITLNELEDVTNVSRKTVLSDLKALQALLPETASIDIADNRVTLQCADKTSIEAFVINLAKNTVTYNILYHVFYEKHANTNDVFDTLFISESTLRKKVKHINKILPYFDCKLSSYSIKIIGEEQNIRCFYYSFFSEFQELYYSKSECMEHNHAKLYERMKMEETDSHLNYGYRQITRWLFITIERINIGKYVYLDRNLVNRIRSRKSYASFKKIYEQELKQHLTTDFLPEDEIVWAFIIRFDTIVYSYAQKNLNLQLYQKEEEDTALINKMMPFIYEMKDVCKVQNDYKANFIEAHEAFLLNISLLTSVTPLFQMASSELKKYVFENLESLYTLWYDCLSKSKEENFFPVHYQSDMAVKLALISSQFVYTQGRTNKTILCSFTGEAGLTAYLETFVKNVLPSGIHVEFMNSDCMTKDLILKINPDIIVCNYKSQEEVEGCELIKMSYLPTAKEKRSFCEYLSKIQYKTL